MSRKDYLISIILRALAAGVDLLAILILMTLLVYILPMPEIWGILTGGIIALLGMSFLEFKQHWSPGKFLAGLRLIAAEENVPYRLGKLLSRNILKYTLMVGLSFFIAAGFGQAGLAKWLPSFILFGLYMLCVLGTFISINTPILGFSLGGWEAGDSYYDWITKIKVIFPGYQKLRLHLILSSLPLFGFLVWFQIYGRA